jgi:hypothetical protein
VLPRTGDLGCRLIFFSDHPDVARFRAWKLRDADAPSSVLGDQRQRLARTMRSCAANLRVSGAHARAVEGGLMGIRRMGREK